jgi:Tol biopolymer transport system component
MLAAGAWRSALALLLLVSGAATVAAQTQQIQSRTPSRGGFSGGTTVEVLGNGWFGSFGLSVTMEGPTGAQPTNVVVHSPNRLTFVTPTRAPGACGTDNVCTVTITSGVSRTTSFTYVPRTRSVVASARKPVFSYNGQYVAFESRFALAANDTNGLIDIYVRNRTTAAVRRVSIASSGAQGLGGESTSPAISANGRFVAFQSRATNLVPGDTNSLMDVFVHDRDVDADGVFDEAGAIATERVSTGSAGTSPTSPPPAQAIGGDSADPAISGNGRYVAFQSAATNLLGTADGNARTDIFVFDRLRRQIRRTSTNANLVQADGHSRNPAMSLSGRFVVFESLANNLAGGLPTVGNPPVPASDIFLHDRDTDEDGIFDESGGIDTQLVSVNPCSSPLTNHSIEPSITYDGNYVVFATVAGNAKVDQFCDAIDVNGARDIYIWDRLGDPPTLRRLSEPPSGSDLPGASGAPVLSGNGSLLLFRTQAVNAGAAVSSATVGFSHDGKSTTGEVPSPTTDTPPDPEIPPAPPTGSTEEPSTSGDGNTTGNTVEPDPGTGGGEPVVELDETPEDPDGTPFIAGLSPASGPTAGGAVVEIQGANFVQGQTTVQWDGGTVAFTHVSSSLLRVTTPNGFFDHPAEVRVISAGEASNEVQYNYSSGLTAPSITSFATVPATNPVSGPTAGGTVVVITGTGFSAPTVRFGPHVATVNSFNATSINVTTSPAAVAGPVPIVVQNSNGTTAASNGPFIYTFANVVAEPVTQPLTPNSGPVTGGTAITITGTGFTPATTVTVGGVPATDVQVLGNTQIVAVTPAGAEGPADVVVSNGIGTPSVETFTYVALAPPVLTCTGTDTDLDGAPDAWETQYGFNPGDGTDGPLDADVDGRTNAQECTDLTHPRGIYARYLAEGATGSFFDTRVVLANPGATPARALFRFQTNLGQVVRHFLVVPAMSRRTVDLRLLPGLESANISTAVESDVQVVVDRTMRWDQVSRAGAHAESSSPAPSLTWYLAEGATHGTFDLFYLIQNPSQTESAQVRVRYLLPAGAPIEQDITVAPNTRATIHVDAQPGLAAAEVSAVISSQNAVPIIVERAMYASAAGTFAAGHDAAGVTSPSLTWFFAEGATGSFFDEFLLLANPNGSSAEVDIRYLKPDGSFVDRSYTVPANSRRTLYVAEQSPALANTAVSATVSVNNAVPIIAERAMWWPHGTAWTEAHAAVGSTTTGIKWAVGDGEVGLLPDDTATFLLVANTAAVATTVRVTLLFETGAAVSQNFTVAANARFTVPIVTSEAPASASYMRVPRGTRFSSVIESLGGTPIVVERAMYWNAGGQLWAAGSDLLATKLQ